jgi:dTDP-glucose 4,6-dehydratase
VNVVANKNLRVLVTGGAGFIGSHFVDKLVKSGADVTVLDNLDTGRMKNIVQHEGKCNFHFVKGDIRDFNMVRKLVKTVDSVFNIAAISSVQRSIENPLLVNEVNVKGTLNLLKASVDSNVNRFVQVSSASIYGDTQVIPVREDVNPMPLSPYAVSKIAAEKYALAFNKSYGIETVCLRYFNVYGPRQANNEYTGVITIFANSILGNKPLTIFGDGEQTRDFVFVKDVVSANMLALTNENAVGEVFNVSSGEARTINEIVQILQKITDKNNVRTVHKKSKKGDIRHSLGSIDKAKKLLGYEPSISLERGLKELIKYMVKASKDNY